MIISGILPIFGFFSIYRFLCGKALPVGPWRRIAFIQAAIIWGVAVDGSCEILSLGHAIKFVPVCLFWLVLIVLFLILGDPAQDKHFLPSLHWKDLTLLEKCLSFFGSLIVILVAVAAFFGCPNSWDALVYHMSRVMFWQQNYCLDDYPTADYRQLFFQPWGEYAELHFQVLTQTDRFATLISWFSYVASAVGMSLVGALFNATRRQQLLMAFSIVTIPTAIIEASGVRLDMIASFWLVALLVTIALFVRTGEWVLVYGVGLSLGLGFLTKGTMYLIAAPLVFLFFYELCRKIDRQKAFLAMLMVLGLALLINAPFYWRNYQLSGNLLGPISLRQWGLCEHMTSLLAVSNIIKNIFCQLGSPFHFLNTAIGSLVNTLHQWIHVDPLDLRSDYNNSVFMTSVSTYEEHVTNCLQVLLILGGGAGLLTHAWRSKRYKIMSIFLALLVSFISVSSSIKWNIHLCRYLLPVMVGSLPLVFLWIDNNRNPRWILWVLVLSLSLTSAPYLLKNNLRRMIGKDKPTIFRTPRLERYFQNSPNFYLPYNQAVDAVLKRGCFNVGLHMETDYWDYPFWLIMKEKTNKKFRFEHVFTDPASADRYPLGDFYPCAIIAVDYDKERIDFGQNYFVKVNYFGRTAVYINPKGDKQKIVPLRF